MSGPAIIWARHQNAGAPHLQSLLAAIAVRVGPQGTTFVSQATLADDVKTKVRQVRRSLAILERLGIIERRIRNTRKGRTSDLIILALHRSFDVDRQALTAAKTVKPSGTQVPVAANDPSGTVGHRPAVLQYQGIDSDQQQKDLAQDRTTTEV